MQKLNGFLLVVSVASVMVSCGPMPQGPMQNQSIDGAFSPYLSEFQRQGEMRGVETDSSHLTMTFNESMPASTIPNCPTCQVLAYCQRTPQGPNVVVKGSYFKTWTIARREAVLFHELGHCLLGLDHNNQTETAFWFGTNSPATVVPSSIMNELQFDESVYSGNRSTYLDREFDHATFVPLYWNAPSQVDTSIYF